MFPLFLTEINNLSVVQKIIQFIPNATLVVSKILESIIINILAYLLLLFCGENKILLCRPIITHKPCHDV